MKYKSANGAKLGPPHISNLDIWGCTIHGWEACLVCCRVCSSSLGLTQEMPVAPPPPTVKAKDVCGYGQVSPGKQNPPGADRGEIMCSLEREKRLKAFPHSFLECSACFLQITASRLQFSGQASHPTHLLILHPSTPSLKRNKHWWSFSRPHTDVFHTFLSDPLCEDRVCTHLVGWHRPCPESGHQGLLNG